MTLSSDNTMEHTNSQLGVKATLTHNIYEAILSQSFHLIKFSPQENDFFKKV